MKSIIGLFLGLILFAGCSCHRGGHNSKASAIEVKEKGLSAQEEDTSKFFYSIQSTTITAQSEDLTTSIFQFDMNKKKSEKVFWDLSANIIIGYTCGSGGTSGALAFEVKGKIFAVGIERTEQNIRFHDCPKNQSLYEISLDGSNRVLNKISLYGDGTVFNPFFDSKGERFGYIAKVVDKAGGEAVHLVIQDTKTGEVIRKFPIGEYLSYTGGFQAVGWFEEVDKIHFNVVLGPEEPGKEGAFILDFKSGSVIKIPKEELAATKFLNEVHSGEAPILEGGKNDQQVFFRQNVAKFFDYDRTSKKVKLRFETPIGREYCGLVKPLSRRLLDCGYQRSTAYYFSEERSMQTYDFGDAISEIRHRGRAATYFSVLGLGRD